MMDPRHTRITDYTYTLPPDKIARYPLPRRDQSRLLVFKNQSVTDELFTGLASHLPQNSLLVFNDSRVVEARLLFRKDSGGVIEIFCLEPGEALPGPATAMLQTGQAKWKCLVGGASKWKPGLVLSKKMGAVELTAKIAGREPDCFLVEFQWMPSDLSFAEILHRAGEIPLPPYLRRRAESSDAERYQTVYASQEGSVAAPTAGLHFTPSILGDLSRNAIEKTFVTLHVGAGTFKPVTTALIGDHQMHTEWISVSLHSLKKIREKTGSIIAVGTTSLRTLESLYWLGVNVLTTGAPGSVSQWQPYHRDPGIRTENSLDALIGWMEANGEKNLLTQTGILIVPGYRFRICDALVTNFHQPGSTLLLLVAAFIGPQWKKIYAHALQKDYRFLSYGDGSLLFRNDP